MLKTYIDFFMLPYLYLNQSYRSANPDFTTAWLSFNFFRSSTARTVKLYSFYITSLMCGMHSLSFSYLEASIKNLVLANVSASIIVNFSEAACISNSFCFCSHSLANFRLVSYSFTPSSICCFILALHYLTCCILWWAQNIKCYFCFLCSSTVSSSLSSASHIFATSYSVFYLIAGTRTGCFLCCGLDIQNVHFLTLLLYSDRLFSRLVIMILVFFSLARINAPHWSFYPGPMLPLLLICWDWLWGGLRGVIRLSRFLPSYLLSILNALLQSIYLTNTKMRELLCSCRQSQHQLNDIF